MSLCCCCPVKLPGPETPGSLEATGVSMPGAWLLTGVAAAASRPRPVGVLERPPPVTAPPPPDSRRELVVAAARIRSVGRWKPWVLK